MAKLKAPLLSFGASGAIAKSLVYFPWKGLDVVREYVVPANPKSDAQIIQRGYMKAAVEEIHDAYVYPDHPLVSTDKSAYARAGSLHRTPRTWFNEAVKIMVDAQRDLQSYFACVSFACTYLAPTTATAVGWSVKVAAPTGFVYFGTSKSSMLTPISATMADHTFSVTLTPLVVGTVYYWQWQATPVAGKAVCKSGIYTYLHKA